ncbi:MAG: hypothetical protein KIPDCIKN_04146 [Haliscomenobacter sp.]|nr:hypothetical protein [Haliscomenobacter sp.]
MDFLPYIPILMIIVYLAIIIGLFYLIYRWVSTIISLKREHNDLLREIIKKLENK